MHWKKQFKKGKLFLTQKKLRKALKCFELAVTDCPVTSVKGLEKSLYYLGLTLKRLGYTDFALRCWQIAEKLNGNGLSEEMIRKSSNTYGMSVCSCEEKDDAAAFLGIHLEKYLSMKKVRRFCSDAERDVIKDIIDSYWQDLQTEGKFAQLTIDRKLQFFRNQIIIFPVADISSFEKNTRLLFADFNEGKVLSMDDLCPCGSGIPINQCCGRIKSAKEIEFGEF